MYDEYDSWRQSQPEQSAPSEAAIDPQLPTITHSEEQQPIEAEQPVDTVQPEEPQPAETPQSVYTASVQPIISIQPKKKTGTGKRALGVVAAAVAFGVIAGGTMLGVNVFGEHLLGRNQTTELTTSAINPTVAVQRAVTQSDSEAASKVSGNMLDVSSIVETAMPSVVAINNTMTYRSESWFGQSQVYEVPSSGSGIIVGQNDDELLIVTNNHVVSESKDLTVVFIDNQEVKAAIKGTDSESDLAVIAVKMTDIPDDTKDMITIAKLGDSDALKVGQGVVAIGNALGYGQSVTVGYISALDREVEAEGSTVRNLLQTDAAINPGNSGGALLNMRGEVVGINAAKYSSTSVEGMGYAIPISAATDSINDMMTKRTRTLVEESKQGYLGIQGQNIDDQMSQLYGMPRGIYVFKIVEDGAAENSELREKDIITKFDGQSVQTMAELKDMLTYYAGGDTISLTVQSLDNGEYKERIIDITLGTKPEADTK